MTIETDIIQPVKDFVRDSKFLVNRCTKPDKKGRIQSIALITRIHSDSYCYCRRIRCDGPRWVFRQVDSYSDQQYSDWCLNYTVVTILWVCGVVAFLVTLTCLLEPISLNLLLFFQTSLQKKHYRFSRHG